jgi:hypothetical protein
MLLLLCGVCLIAFQSCFVGYGFEKQQWMDKENHTEVIWRKALVGDGSYPKKVMSIVEDQHLSSKRNIVNLAASGIPLGFFSNSKAL